MQDSLSRKEKELWAVCPGHGVLELVICLGANPSQVATLSTAEKKGMYQLAGEISLNLSSKCR